MQLLNAITSTSGTFVKSLPPGDQIIADDTLTAALRKVLGPIDTYDLLCEKLTDVRFIPVYVAAAVDIVASVFPDVSVHFHNRQDKFQHSKIWLADTEYQRRKRIN